MKNNYWKPYAELTKEEQEDAKEFRPHDYESWSYHFDGVILTSAAK